MNLCSLSSPVASRRAVTTPLSKGMITPISTGETGVGDTERPLAIRSLQRKRKENIASSWEMRTCIRHRRRSNLLPSGLCLLLMWSLVVLDLFEVIPGQIRSKWVHKLQFWTQCLNHGTRSSLSFSSELPQAVEIFDVVFHAPHVPVDVAPESKTERPAQGNPQHDLRQVWVSNDPMGGKEFSG